MIAKCVKRRKGSPSSAEKLVKYLLNEKSLDSGERVVGERITNCMSDDIDFATKEIIAIQAMNQTVKSDKTYHLVLSFQENDNPSLKDLEEMEEYFCNVLGFGEHQRVSVVHGDTNNLHVHIVINQIHPETHKIHIPFQEYPRLLEGCRVMEKKYNLLENLVVQEKPHSMALNGMESFSSWLKTNAKEDLLEAFKIADTWEEFQESAARFDIEFRKSGAGMAISHRNEKLYVKASSIDRSFSIKKLTEKFGDFVDGGTSKDLKASMSYKKSPLAKESQSLWSEYLSYKNTTKERRNELISQVKEEKSERLNAINERVKSRRAILKTNFRMNFSEKKVERSRIAAEFLDQKQELSRWYKDERQKISKENKTLDWSEWLQERGGRGDVEAIKALKRVKNKDSKPKDDEAFMYGFKPKDYLASVRYEVKRNGDVHYKVGDSIIIDAGSKISVKAGASKEATEFALDLAKKRFGNNLRFKGNDQVIKGLKEMISQERGLSR